MSIRSKKKLRIAAWSLARPHAKLYSQIMPYNMLRRREILGFHKIWYPGQAGRTPTRCRWTVPPTPSSPPTRARTQNQRRRAPSPPGRSPRTTFLRLRPGGGGCLSRRGCAEAGLGRRRRAEPGVRRWRGWPRHWRRRREGPCSTLVQAPGTSFWHRAGR